MSERLKLNPFNLADLDLVLVLVVVLENSGYLAVTLMEQNDP
jgi:hypothetical protein